MIKWRSNIPRDGTSIAPNKKRGARIEQKVLNLAKMKPGGPTRWEPPFAGQMSAAMTLASSR